LKEKEKKRTAREKGLPSTGKPQDRPGKGRKVLKKPKKGKGLTNLLTEEGQGKETRERKKKRTV